ncbi:MAG: hypothetical protein Q4C70_01950 [Planctomycetia bacterium]|nr:hypothetical protein [Planctomycetia bacterium]
MKKYLRPIMVGLALLGPFMYWGAMYYFSLATKDTSFVKDLPSLQAVALLVFIFWGALLATPIGLFSSIMYIVMMENKNKNWWKVVLVSLLGIVNLLSVYPIFWLICHLFR